MNAEKNKEAVSHRWIDVYEKYSYFLLGFVVANLRGRFFAGDGYATSVFLFAEPLGASEYFGQRVFYFAFIL